MPKKIKTIEQLKRGAKKSGGFDFFIALKHSCKSSKHISFDGNDFYVDNYIDGSSDVFTEIELLESNIGRALKKGALYAD